MRGELHPRHAGASSSPPPPPPPLSDVLWNGHILFPFCCDHFSFVSHLLDRIEHWVECGLVLPTRTRLSWYDATLSLTVRTKDQGLLLCLQDKTYVVYIKMDNPTDYTTWKVLANCFHLWDLDVRGFHKVRVAHVVAASSSWCRVLVVTLSLTTRGSIAEHVEVLSEEQSRLCGRSAFLAILVSASPFGLCFFVFSKIRPSYCRIFVAAKSLFRCQVEIVSSK